MDGWIQTHSGRAVDPLQPDPKSIVVEDIAHALSHVNRYTGHTRAAYSVGRHSITVSYLMRIRGFSAQGQLWGLLHDATEAYLGDIASPVKQSPIFAGYRTAEKHLESVIRQRFMPNALGVPLKDVKVADWDMLLAERDEVLPPGAWVAEQPPADARESFTWGVGLDSPQVVRTTFLSLFSQLGGVP